MCRDVAIWVSQSSSAGVLGRSPWDERGFWCRPRQRRKTMCRNIKTLFNFDPPATEDEIQASALQFVRKLSGFNKPSKINEAVFDQAVEQVTEAASTLIQSL